MPLFDLNSILEFSRNNCVAICSVLVPLNLLATLQTLILTGIKRSGLEVLLAVGFASFCALLMVLHVLTWFLVGVVMVPTYVLLALGTVCLNTNLWALWHPQSMRGLLLLLGRSLKLLEV